MRYVTPKRVTPAQMEERKEEGESSQTSHGVQCIQTTPEEVIEEAERPEERKVMVTLGQLKENSSQEGYWVYVNVKRGEGADLATLVG